LPDERTRHLGIKIRGAGNSGPIKKTKNIPGGWIELAEVVYLKKDAIPTNGFVGFSWTVFFFGFFVPLIRGDYKWFLIMLVIDCLTVYVVGNIIMAFMYNKIYTKGLMVDKGFIPADDYSAQKLRAAGILCRTA